MPLTKNIAPNSSEKSFFGMEFNQVFDKDSIFTHDLRKSSQTNNPTPIAQIDLVYVLSARTTALGNIADIELIEQNKRAREEFDITDDIDRLRQGIKIAIEVSALRAGKQPNELTEEDYVIPIFYNGRPVHNKDLKCALSNPELQRQLGIEPFPYYPARLFTISPIYNPKKNTVGQAQSFRNYLEYHCHEHIAIVSSAFHLPRVARTLGLDSPQMDEANLDDILETKMVNPLANLKLYLFGVHKNQARPGITMDLEGEVGAMQNYSAGDNPSISRYQSRNVFFTDQEIYSTKSFARALFWNGYSQKKLINEKNDKQTSLSII